MSICHDINCSVLSHSLQPHGLWTAACYASPSITNSRSLFKLMSIDSVMPSTHLILCSPLLPLPSIFPSIKVFSNESVLCIRWPKYWSFSFSISPSNEYSGLISFRIDWLALNFKALEGSMSTLCLLPVAKDAALILLALFTGFELLVIRARKRMK